MYLFSYTYLKLPKGEIDIFRPKVSPDMLSPYCKMIKEEYGISIGQVAKLIPTLVDKKNYVLHYKKFEALFFSWLETEKSASCFGI